MKDRKYRVVITEINDNGEEVLHNDVHKGLMMVADNDDEGAVEILVNTKLTEVAAMLASGEKTRIACQLANLMLTIARDAGSDFENQLVHLIEKNTVEGGLQ